MKKLLVSLVGVSALSIGVACAAPKPYSGFVVFGDSLVDAGQFEDTSVPGQTKRFTNRVDGSPGAVYGKVSSMLIGERLGISSTQLAGSTSPVREVQGQDDGDNWAVGGYRTDQIYDSITGVGGSVVVDGSTTRTRDGYLPSLQAQGRSIDPNTLFYLSGGGNDFLQFLITNPQQAADSANRLADGVEALQKAGGRYFMVWMLPDVGLTPAISGTPLQGFVSALGIDFNTQLVQRLAQVNAEVIALNIPKLFSEGLADPGAFGLDGNQDLTGTCFSVSSDCTENLKYGINSATPDPTKLLFNDGVHPTITGQRLIADYGYSILAAPWEVTLLPEMARSSLNQHQKTLQNHALNGQSSWQATGQWHSFAAVSGERSNYRTQKSASDGDSNNYGLSFGGSYRLDEQWRAGVGVSLQENSLTAGAEDSKYRLNSYLLSPFIQYSNQALWGDLSLSAGRLDYASLHRKLALNTAARTEKGDTDGSVLAVHARVGYQLFSAQDPLQLSPFVSMSHARFKVDDYAEKGDRSTAITFSEQKRTSKRLGVGLLASYQLTAPLSVSAEIGYEKEFADDQQKLGMYLNSVDSVRFRLQGYEPDSSVGSLGLGATYKLSDALSVQGNYNYTHADSIRQHGLGVGVSLNW